MRGYKAFIAMLKKTGVVFKVTKSGLYKTVVVMATLGPRNEGLEGLYTAFVFNVKSGLLESVGTWQSALA